MGFAAAMMGHVDRDMNGTISMGEWLAYVKGIFDKNEKAAASVLKLYEKQIGENKDMKLQKIVYDWKLGAEAVRICELANLRNSKEFARAMMGHVDRDMNGTISLDEWLAYVKGIFDKSEKAAASVLKLYEKQIGENKDIKLKTAA